MNCTICRKESGEAFCEACLGMGPAEAVEAYCGASDSRNPLLMAQEVMSHPSFPLAGQAHHPLVAAVLVAAYRNAGGEIAPDAVAEAVKRGNSLPGGFCAGFGSDVAAVACGIAASVILRNTIKAESAAGRALAHALTGEAMLSIANNTGNRCCKRSVYGVLELASHYLNRTLGARLETPAERVRCPFPGRNGLCDRKACRYYPD